jgi:hypothetical protein
MKDKSMNRDLLLPGVSSSRHGRGGKIVANQLNMENARMSGCFGAR